MNELKSAPFNLSDASVSEVQPKTDALKLKKGFHERKTENTVYFLIVFANGIFV